MENLIEKVKKVFAEDCEGFGIYEVYVSPFNGGICIKSAVQLPAELELRIEIVVLTIQALEL